MTGDVWTVVTRAPDPFVCLFMSAMTLLRTRLGQCGTLDLRDWRNLVEEEVVCWGCGELGDRSGGYAAEALLFIYCAYKMH